MVWIRRGGRWYGEWIWEDCDQRGWHHMVKRWNRSNAVWFTGMGNIPQEVLLNVVQLLDVDEVSVAASSAICGPQF